MWGGLMLNIAIVDDEKIFTEKLKKTVKNICTENDVVCDIECMLDGFSVLEEYYKYDIIFLDIEMPNLNGIEIAKKINDFKNLNHSPYIIFVTNKDNLVFAALKQLPYSFIRKSSLDEDTSKCIIKINSLISKKQKKYSIKVGRNIVVADIDSIIYLEKKNNYVVFHTLKNTYSERSNIDIKYDELSENNFIRPHIGYLVNMKYISELRINELQLQDGTIIPVSKKYRAKVKDEFYDWMVTIND